MITGVGDVNVIARINRDPFRPTELAVTIPAAAPAHDETSSRRELLDSMIAEVSNVNIAGRINRDTARAIQELSITAAGRAPGELENAARIKLLHYPTCSFGEAVAHVDIARGTINCYAGRTSGIVQKFNASGVF